MSDTEEIRQTPVPFNVLIGEAGQMIFDIALAVKEVAIGKVLQRETDRVVFEILDVEVHEEWGLAYQIVQLSDEGVFVGEPEWVQGGPAYNVEDVEVTFNDESGSSFGVDLRVAKDTLVLAVLATGKV